MRRFSNSIVPWFRIEITRHIYPRLSGYRTEMDLRGEGLDDLFHTGHCCQCQLKAENIKKKLMLVCD